MNNIPMNPKTLNMKNAAPRYDVYDEILLTASPDQVFRALLAELEGKTRWWAPHLSGKQVKGNAVYELGAEFEIVIRVPVRIASTFRTVEIEAPTLVRTDYIAGPWRGEGIWWCEAQNGKTRLSLRWRATLVGWIPRLIGKVFNVPKAHSRVIQLGFAGLAEHLEASNVRSQKVVAD